MVQENPREGVTRSGRTPGGEVPRESLVTTLIRTIAFLCGTWFILWLGAENMDDEYITGLLIAAFYITAEALHMDPGRSIRRVFWGIRGRKDPSDGASQ